MKIKSLFISAQEKNAGTLFVSMGIMEILKRNLHRVAFFRPIIYSKDIRDGDISFILQRYDLGMPYEDTYGFDIEYVEHMIASHKTNELINALIVKFKKLENEYDFVLCEGIRRSFLTRTINYDLNLKIAQNFGSSYINIINAKKLTLQEIYEEILMENENSINHPLVKPNERRIAKVNEGGTSSQLLSNHFPGKQIEPYIIKFKKHSDSKEIMTSNYPGQEFCFVLKGFFEVKIDGNSYFLKEGDSFYFDSKRTHLFKNLTDKEAELIWVITPYKN